MRLAIVPYCPDPRHVMQLWRYDIVIKEALKAGHAAEYYRPEGAYDLAIVSMAQENIETFRAIQRRGLPIAGDITDDLLTFPFSNYTPLGNLYYRAKYALNGRFRVFAEMLRGSNLIIAGSDRQCEIFSAYNSNTVRVTDAVAADTLALQASYKNDGPCKLVWFGNVSSLHGFDEAGDAFDRLAAQGNYELVLITPDYVQGRYLGAWPRTVHEFMARQKMPCRWVPWTYDSLLRESCASDIAVIPVDMREPFVTAKPAGRALLMMGMGLPTVTGPLQSYITDIPDGAGFIARTPDDWVTAIARLAASPDLRQTVGTKAKQAVTAGFSEPVFGKKYLAALERVLPKS